MGIGGIQDNNQENQSQDADSPNDKDAKAKKDSALQPALVVEEFYKNQIGSNEKINYCLAFIMQFLSENNDLKIEDKELNKSLKKQATAYNSALLDYKKYLEKHGITIEYVKKFQLAQEILNQKLSDLASCLSIINSEELGNSIKNESIVEALKLYGEILKLINDNSELYYKHHS